MAKKSQAKDARPMVAMDDPWQAEDDLRTLSRAEEIRSSSPRMAACKKHLRKQTRTMTKALTRGR